MACEQYDFDLSYRRNMNVFKKLKHGSIKVRIYPENSNFTVYHHYKSKTTLRVKISDSNPFFVFITAFGNQSSLKGLERIMRGAGK